MNRTKYPLFLSTVLLVLALVACGPQSQPTANVQPTKPVQPTTAVQPTKPVQPTPLPQATEETRPTAGPTAAAGATVGAGFDLSGAFDRMNQLPGFHYDGTFKGQETGKAATYVRFVEDADTSGNYHLTIYDKEGGDPAAEFYYVGQHFYVGQAGTFVDVGVQTGEQATTMYKVYMLPFQMTLAGATNLQQVGHEDVNGLSTTKYQADFSQWASSYLQAGQGVQYTSSGFVWVSDQYNVVVKSEVHVSWTQGTTTADYESQSEISQVGQVATIQPPSLIPLPKP